MESHRLQLRVVFECSRTKTLQTFRQDYLLQEVIVDERTSLDVCQRLRKSNLAESTLTISILVDIVERVREVDIGQARIIAERRVTHTQRSIRHFEVIERDTLKESVILNGLQLTLSVPQHLLQSKAIIESTMSDGLYRCIAHPSKAFQGSTLSESSLVYAVHFQGCSIKRETFQASTPFECFLADVHEFTLISHVHAVQFLSLNGSMRFNLCYRTRDVDTLQLVLAVESVAPHFTYRIFITIIDNGLRNIDSTRVVLRHILSIKRSILAAIDTGHSSLSVFIRRIFQEIVETSDIHHIVFINNNPAF